MLVAIEITQGSDAAAKVIAVLERGSAANAAGNLRTGLHRAVGVHEEHVHSAAADAARIIAERADG